MSDLPQFEKVIVEERSVSTYEEVKQLIDDFDTVGYLVDVISIGKEPRGFGGITIGNYYKLYIHYWRTVKEAD